MNTREKIMFLGNKNPVRAAYLFLTSSPEIKLKVDEESFLKLAEEIGEVEFEGGFLVQTLDDVQKLCDIGGFSIALSVNAGCIRAIRTEHFGDSAARVRTWDSGAEAATAVEPVKLLWFCVPESHRATVIYCRGSLGEAVSQRTAWASNQLRETERGRKELFFLIDSLRYQVTHELRKTDAQP